MTYSVKQVAERYAVNEATVRTWIRSGELRALSINRKLGAKKVRWRVTQESLTAFELLRSASPPPQPKTRRRKRNDSVIEFY